MYFIKHQAIFFTAQTPLKFSYKELSFFPSPLSLQCTEAYIQVNHVDNTPQTLPWAATAIVQSEGGMPLGAERDNLPLPLKSLEA